MNADRLRGLLERLTRGEASVEDALRALRVAPFEDLGFARVDHHRHIRCGFPEAVFAQGKTAEQVLAIAQKLKRDKDFSITSERTVELNSRGKDRIADAVWTDLEHPLNPGQRQELVRQALVALYLFDLDKHYLVKDGKVQIIDEYTGRLMADRSWERGLHQLIEVKEECEISPRKETRARISYQRFFRRYLGLAGMTGTAREVAGELWSIYRLRVVTIPTDRPMQRHFLPDRIYPNSV